MQAYRIATTVQPDGSLILRNLPLHAGETVEIIILTDPSNKGIQQQSYPLHGMTVIYQDPTAPVAQDDWEATK